MANPDKARLVPALRDILAHGALVRTVRNTDPKKPNILEYHWIEADVDVGGRVLRAGITVEHHRDGKNYYNINPVKENGPGDTQASGNTNAGREYDQGDEINIGLTDEKVNRRGSIQFPPAGPDGAQTVINLFESADLSTFTHEAGHFPLEVTDALARDPRRHGGGVGQGERQSAPCPRRWTGPGARGAERGAARARSGSRRDDE
ncbi:hypothetical protein [Paracoccus sp. (in: a-proteobacteria)]|uniref:LPD3 domain-containing protein n=1 Tax=Paracoccus sp. TaxID=267 RepID=UPI0039E566FB